MNAETEKLAQHLEAEHGSPWIGTLRTLSNIHVVLHADLEKKPAHEHDTQLRFA